MKITEATILGFGSILDSLGNPTTEFIYNEMVRKWEIESNSSVKYTITERRFIDKRDRIFFIIDKFSDIFPQIVIENAKRIAYDIKSKTFSSLAPSTAAISAIYLACKLKRINFKKRREDIIKIMNENRQSWFIKKGDKFFSTVQNYSDLLEKENEDKIKIWREFNAKNYER